MDCLSRSTHALATRCIRQVWRLSTPWRRGGSPYTSRTTESIGTSGFQTCCLKKFAASTRHFLLGHREFSERGGSGGQRFSDRGLFSCAIPQGQSHVINLDGTRRRRSLVQSKIVVTRPPPEERGTALAGA